MLGLILKHRIYLVGLILLVYTSSTFQKPLIEALHFIAHSFDYTSGKVKIHTFDSHSGDHSHNLLANLSEIDSEDTPSDLPQNTMVDTKKIFDHIFPTSISIFAINKICLDFSKLKIPLHSGFTCVINPPPQLFHFA